MTNNPAVKLKLTASDPTSGIKRIYISNHDIPQDIPINNLITLRQAGNSEPSFPSEETGTVTIDNNTHPTFNLDTNLSNANSFDSKIYCLVMNGEIYKNLCIDNIPWRLKSRLDDSHIDGVRTVYFRFEDQAGNLSEQKCISTGLDTTLPSNLALLDGSKEVNGINDHQLIVTEEAGKKVQTLIVNFTANDIDVMEGAEIPYYEAGEYNKKPPLALAKFKFLFPKADVLITLPNGLANWVEAIADKDLTGVTGSISDIGPGYWQLNIDLAKVCATALQSDYAPDSLVVSGIRIHDRADNQATLLLGNKGFYSAAETGVLANGGDPIIQFSTTKDNSNIVVPAYSLGWSITGGSLDQKLRFMSMNVPGSGNTQAKLYDAGNWPVWNSGAASASLVLKQGNNEWLLPSHAYPRATLAYRLVATNHSGDETWTDFTYSIPNQAPAEPKIVTPLVHTIVHNGLSMQAAIVGTDADSTSEISWNIFYPGIDTRDMENDSVIYRLWAVKAGSAAQCLMFPDDKASDGTKTTTTASTVLVKDLYLANPSFFSGLKEFSWWVEADDQQIENNHHLSGTQAVLIDNSHPAVSLKAAVTDGSGLAYVGPAGSLAINVAKDQNWFGTDQADLGITWSLRNTQGQSSYDRSGIITLAPSTASNALLSVAANPTVPKLITGAGTLMDALPLTAEATGNYALELRVEDWAGHIATLSAPYAFMLDTTSPSCQAGIADQIKTAGDTAAVKVVAQDGSSGISAIQYQLLNAPGDPIRDTAWKILRGAGFGTDSFSLARILDTSALADGQTVYPALQVIDMVGNISSPTVLAKGLLVDRRIPALTLKAYEATSQKALVYVPSLQGFADDSLKAEITINWQGIASDLQSQCTWQYGLVASGQDQTGTAIAWQANLSGLADTHGLIDGASYELVARCLTPTGGIASAHSASFIVDSRSPESVRLLRFPDQVLAKEESSSISLQVVSHGSPIQSVKLWLEDSSGTIYTGIQDAGWIQGVYEVPSAALALPTCSLRIPSSMPDGLYRVVILAKDAAGHEVVLRPVDGTITVNNQEHVIVNGMGAWMAPGAALRGTWRMAASGEVDTWQYRLMAGSGLGSPVQDWQAGSDAAHELAMAVSAGGFQPIAGQDYWWEVDAQLKSGDRMSGKSQSMRLDESAPRIIAGSLKVPAYARSALMPISWQAQDSESAISAVMVQAARAELVDGQTVLLPISDWMPVAANAGSNGSSVGNDIHVAFTKAGLPVNLADGQTLVISLRVQNGAGMVSDAVIGSCIIDNSAPPLPIVRDGAGYFNPYPHGLNTAGQPWPGDGYAASWAFGRSDPESGSSYRWALTTDPGLARQNPSALTWQTVEPGIVGMALPDNSLAFPSYPDQTTVYLAVCATNGAGLSSIGLTDGKIIDANAPRSPQVSLRYQSSGESRPYLDQTKKLSLVVESQDDGSGTAAVAVRLKYQVPGSQTQNEIPDLINLVPGSVLGMFNADLPAEVGAQVSALADGTILVAEASATDAVGNQRTAQNAGTYLESAVPTINPINVLASNGGVYGLWQLESHAETAAGFQLEVSKIAPNGGKDMILAKTLAAGKRDLYLDGASLQGDGYYQLLLTPLGRNGIAGDAASSAQVAIDTTPAVFSSGTVIPGFADMHLNFSLSAEDSMSRIVEYQYSLGNFTDQTAYSATWSGLLTAVTRTDRQTADVQFNDLARVPAQDDRTFLYYRVKNSNGLWSDLVQSPVIRIDHTAPVISALNSPEYALTQQILDGNSVSAEDGESGVVAWRYKVVPMGTSAIDLSGVDSETIKQELVLDGGKIKDYVFGVTAEKNTLWAEDGAYQVLYQIQNGAGTWSPVASGPKVVVDTIVPSASFTYQDWLIPASRNYVTNTGKVEVGASPTSSAPYYTLHDNDIVSIIFALDEPNGYQGLTEFKRPLKDGKPDLTVEFKPSFSFDQASDAYGLYVLRMCLTDKAGHVQNYAAQSMFKPDAPGSLDAAALGALSADQYQYLRVNMPPAFDMSGFNLVTTPAKPQSMRVSGFLDPDGDDSTLSVTAIYPDTSQQTEVWTNPGNGNGSVVDYLHPFYQNNDIANAWYPEETEYPVLFKITDARGKESALVTDRKVRVLNTSFGTLYTNEYWAGNQSHMVQGTVTVPAGLTLTILGAEAGYIGQVGVNSVSLPDDKVKATTMDIGLVIQGTLKMKAMSFITADDPYRLWNGISIETGGRLELETAQIEDADRAIVLKPGSSSVIHHAVIRNGNIGLHVLANVGVVADCTFYKMFEYGVKMETGGAITLRNTNFLNTPRIYYEDSPRTILSLTELNALSGYQSNTSANN